MRGALVRRLGSLLGQKAQHPSNRQGHSKKQNRKKV